MNIYELNIKSVLDIPEWEKLQDQFARLTGTAMITIDYKGNPVSRVSGCTDFCTAILNNPTTRKRCFKCNALAGLEAAEQTFYLSVSQRIDGRSSAGSGG